MCYYRISVNGFLLNRELENVKMLYFFLLLLIGWEFHSLENASAQNQEEVQLDKVQMDKLRISRAYVHPLGQTIIVVEDSTVRLGFLTARQIWTQIHGNAGVYYSAGDNTFHRIPISFSPSRTGLPEYNATFVVPSAEGQYKIAKIDVFQGPDSPRELKVTCEGTSICFTESPESLASLNARLSAGEISMIPTPEVREVKYMFKFPGSNEKYILVDMPPQIKNFDDVSLVNVMFSENGLVTSEKFYVTQLTKEVVLNLEEGSMLFFNPLGFNDAPTLRAHMFTYDLEQVSPDKITSEFLTRLGFGNRYLPLTTLTSPCEMLDAIIFSK
jgi:hypothetical protein